MNKARISIRGMHCKSCALQIEDKINELPSVSKVRVNFRRALAEVEFSNEADLDRVEEKIREAGYDIGADDKKPWLTSHGSDYKAIFFSVLALVAIYFLARQTGFVDFINYSATGDPSSLVVVGLLGLTAGFSTCMALVGGLLLGISARHAEKHPSATSLQKFRPHIFFNAGRITAYFILGGAIGLIGQAFQLSGILLGALMIVVGLVMLFLGIQLSELSPRLSGVSLSLPSSISRLFGSTRRDKEYSHSQAIVSGALTFFLPCGFTQAMQLFAMSSGGFLSGALIMAVFAIGTAPGLLGLGGLTSVVRGNFAKKFYKFTGVVVIAFAVITVSNGYTLTGWKSGITGLFNGDVSSNEDYQQQLNSYSRPVTSEPAPVLTNAEEVQVIKTTYTSLDEDIVPNSFTLEVGKPVRFEVSVMENGRGCMSTIMVPGLYNRPIYLSKGKTIVMEFTPTRAGTYDIACAMGVPRGKIIVK